MSHKIVSWGAFDNASHSCVNRYACVFVCNHLASIVIVGYRMSIANHKVG